MIKRSPNQPGAVLCPVHRRALQGAQTSSHHHLFSIQLFHNHSCRQEEQQLPAPDPVGTETFRPKWSAAQRRRNQRIWIHRLGTQRRGQLMACLDPCGLPSVRVHSGLSLHETHGTREEETKCNSSASSADPVGNPVLVVLLDIHVVPLSHHPRHRAGLLLQLAESPPPPAQMTLAPTDW